MLSPFAHHSNTAYAPSEDEIPAIRDEINMREADEHKAILSPIEHIDYDILSSIFLSVLDIVGHKHLNVSKSHPAVVLVISHVCQRWRETALSIKLLWRHVHFRIPFYPSSSENQDTWRAKISKLVEMTEVWISRSDDCHLSVRIYEHLAASSTEGETGAFVMECIEFHKLVEVLCSSSPRWKDVDLRIGLFLARFPDFPTIRLLTVPPQSTPTLTNFKLSCSMNKIRQNMRPLSQHLVSSTNIFSAPTLRSLGIGPRILAHDTLRMPVVWSTLEGFTGSIGNSSTLFDAVEALALLKECPNLVTCNLPLERETIIPINRAPISLPRLGELILRPYKYHLPKGFAKSLILPSLRKPRFLTGDSRCSPREHRENGLFEFFECFGSALEEVTFSYESLTQAGLHHSLRFLPKVTFLELFHPYRFESDIRVENGLVAASLNRDFFMDLKAQFDAAGFAITQSPLCPNIEVLRFTGAQRGLDEDALFDFIATRRREVNNQPACLGKVTCSSYTFKVADPSEDSWFLATLLSNPSVTVCNIPKVLSVYDAVRRPFAVQVCRRSHHNGSSYTMNHPEFENRIAKCTSHAEQEQVLKQLGEAVKNNWERAWSSSFNDCMEAGVVMLKTLMISPSDATH